MESQSSDFSRCLRTMLVWFLLSIFAGMLVAYFGPGAAAIVVGLLLGLCGMAVHIFLWVIERTPHWSYAGLVFGSVTTLFLFIVSGSSSWQPSVLFIIFISLSFLSYVIYPIANRVLGASPKRSLLAYFQKFR